MSWESMCQRSEELLMYTQLAKVRTITRIVLHQVRDFYTMKVVARWRWQHKFHSHEKKSHFKLNLCSDGGENIYYLCFKYLQVESWDYFKCWCRGRNRNGRNHQVALILEYDQVFGFRGRRRGSCLRIRFVVNKKQKCSSLLEIVASEVLQVPSLQLAT